MPNDKSTRPDHYYAIPRLRDTNRRVRYCTHRLHDLRFDRVVATPRARVSPALARLVTGIIASGFAGSLTLSYATHRDGWIAILHAVFGWGYLLYRAADGVFGALMPL